MLDREPSDFFHASVERSEEIFILGGWGPSDPPPKNPRRMDSQNFHPKFPPESFGTLIDRCTLKNWSYFWWSHADSMKSNPVLSRKTLRKVLGCRRNPGPLMSSMAVPVDSMSSMTVLTSHPATGQVFKKL